MLSSCRLHDTKTTHITVDDRERRSGVAALLQRHEGVEVTVRRLAVGDYVVEDTLAVERKTVMDFAVSLCDGRLFRQALHLRTSVAYDRVRLVLEGAGSELRRMNLSREAIQGALVSLTLAFDLPVLRSGSPAETAKIILMAADQLRRREQSLMPRRGPRPKDIRRIQLLMLQAVPDIGPVKATALLEGLGSPAAIADASFEEIEATYGIGPETATRLHAVLHTGDQPASHQDVGKH